MRYIGKVLGGVLLASAIGAQAGEIVIYNKAEKVKDGCEYTRTAYLMKGDLDWIGEDVLNQLGISALAKAHDESLETGKSETYSEGGVVVGGQCVVFGRSYFGPKMRLFKRCKDYVELYTRRAELKLDLPKKDNRNDDYQEFLSGVSNNPIAKAHLSF